jgi:hypothetical protein
MSKRREMIGFHTGWKICLIPSQAQFSTCTLANSNQCDVKNVGGVAKVLRHITGRRRK